MAVTFDQNEINEACRTFDIEPQDYYMECKPGLVYMHWTATVDELTAMVQRKQQCVDLNIKSKWVPLSDIDEGSTPERLTACRYIFAVE